MFKKSLYLLMALFSFAALPSNAATVKSQCYVQLNKDPQWAGYDVTISMFDMGTNKTIQNFILKKASKNSPSVNSLKKPFNCIQHPLFSFRASFSPPIWTNEAGKEYLAQKVWNLNSQLLERNKNTSIVITINFPGDFVDVPGLVNLSTHST